MTAINRERPETRALARAFRRDHRNMTDCSWRFVPKALGDVSLDVIAGGERGRGLDNHKAQQRKYIAKAQEAERNAAKAKNEQSRADWLRIAQKYRELALAV